MKTEYRLIDLVYFLLFNNLRQAVTTNINVDHILQLKLPSNIKSINKEAAYFGYSLSFSKEDRNTWLYIGAPRANTIEQKNLNITNPGAVFKCLLFDFYSDESTDPTESCVQVPIDETNEVSDNNTKIIKDDQWLGANIYATSYNSHHLLLACSYRWRIKLPSKQYYYAKGSCYGIQSTNNVDLIYLKGTNAANFPGSNVSVFNEGFAQFGASIGISMDSGYIAIGAPGLWQWRGGIVVRISDNTCTIQNLDLPEDSYLGYSVIWIDLKNSNNDGYQTLVAGAPRANLFGKVFIFSIYQNCSSNVQQVLDGKQFGSYFGSILLAVALNSGKLGDLLLVGAPLYNQSNGDEGAVFMYLDKNSNGMELVGILKGSERRGSKFGSTIELLGDTNLDSYNDVVISAPYEESGVIYIYLGTRDGLELKFSQVISARQIFGNEMQRIGISMKSLLNSNGYPVLAIGNHKNDSVVVLGSQPFHGLEISMKFDTEKIEWSHGQCGARGEQLVKLNLSLIFTYIVPKQELIYGTPYNFLSNITYWLDMDVLMRNKRGYIESRLDKSWMEKVSENISFKEINLVKQLTRMWTVVFPITRQPNNISVPVIFAANISQKTDKNIQKKLVNTINDFIYLKPALNSLNGNNFSSSINFHKECGLDDVCLPKFKLSFNETEIIAIIGSQSPLVIPARVINDGESAYSVQIRITHPVIISFDSVLISRDSCNRLLCIPESLKNIQDVSTNTVINCDLENTIRTENVLDFDLYFTWNKHFDWLITPESIGLKIMVRNNETSVEEAIKIRTKYVAQVVEISKTREEFPLPKNKILIINQRMELRNIGPGIIPQFKIYIFHLAFFNQFNTTSIIVTHKKRAESINRADKVQILEWDLSLEEVPPGSNNLNLPYLEDFLHQQQYSPDKHLILDCVNIKCINLKTTVEGFGVEDSIEIAINHNLDENLVLIIQSYDSTTFENEGLVIPALLNTTSSDWWVGCCEADATSSLNCCTELLALKARSTVRKEKEEKLSPPTWVIILGIIVGVLFMCLLILILWKCGFFRRSKHEQLIAEKKRSRIISMIDDSAQQTVTEANTLGATDKETESSVQQTGISNTKSFNNSIDTNKVLDEMSPIIETEKNEISDKTLPKSSNEIIETDTIIGISNDIPKNRTSAVNKESILQIDKDKNTVKIKDLEVPVKSDTNENNINVLSKNEGAKMETKL